MAEPPEKCIVETPNDGGATHIFVIGTDIEKYGEAGFAAKKSKPFTWLRLTACGRSFLVTTCAYTCALARAGPWIRFLTNPHTRAHSGRGQGALQGLPVRRPA